MALGKKNVRLNGGREGVRHILGKVFRSLKLEGFRSAFSGWDFLVLVEGSVANL